MAIQFLFRLVVEYNSNLHYFGYRCNNRDIGFSILWNFVCDSLGCSFRDIRVVELSVVCEVNDGLPF